MKANQVSCDIKVSNEVDKIQKQYETKEMKIYSLFASVFHNYIDASRKIDQSAFTDAIMKINTELARLKRLESSIRAFFSASDTDSTEEALSLFILNTALNS